jgi:glutamate formiminotransferase/formiminotetrahydrofolate cyclodeaminase
VRTLGLSEVKPFDPTQRIIEYRLAQTAPLAQMTLRAFVDELSGDSPAPGGGSVSALAGSLAAALAAMVANLSHARKGFEKHQKALEEIAVHGQHIKDELLGAVDADTVAFDALLAAMRLPQTSADEKHAREQAIASATVTAIEVPLGVLERCPEIVQLCLDVAGIGLKASLSDAGVGAQMARAAAVPTVPGTGPSSCTPRPSAPFWEPCVRRPRPLRGEPRGRRPPPPVASPDENDQHEECER